MLDISVPLIMRNIVKLKYPVKQVLESILPVANQVVLCYDPKSEDNTEEYLYSLVEEFKEEGYRNVSFDFVESVWNLDNISSTGAEFSRQTNIALDKCKSSFVFSIQCDEAIHEKDYVKIAELIEQSEEKYIDAYSMTRLYFYGSIDYLRLDWTVPIVRFFKNGTRKSCGDAMNTEGFGMVEDCEVPIYHYSRIGDPLIISERILSLDKLFHDENKLLKSDELKPYNFDTHNFDCMHKESVDVGRKKVLSNFVKFEHSHPYPFVGYTGV